MKESVAESARSAGAALQPAVEATMAGLSRETATLHDTVTQAVQRQLDGMTAGLQAVSYTHLDVYKRQGVQGLARHAQAGGRGGGSQVVGHGTRRLQVNKLIILINIDN